MTRVFFASQPGVLAMAALVPGPPEEVAFRWDYLGKTFYAASRGKGWVLMKPSFLVKDNVLDPRNPPSVSE